MRKIIVGMALVLLVGVVAASGAALLAGSGNSGISVRPDAPSKDTQPFKGFESCPTPACMAPCSEPPEPQVMCKGPGGGSAEVTSYFCCCCGGGGNSFKWLK